MVFIRTFFNRWSFICSTSAALLCAAILMLAGCGSVAQTPDAPSAAHAKGDPMQVTVSSALAKQLELNKASLQDVSKNFRASGRVQADEQRLARVGPSVTGRVQAIYVADGDYVKRGQVLATLYSTELSTVELTFLEARSRQQLAEKAVSRAEQLLKADVIGSAELQKRQTELQEKIEEVSAARAQLKILGISDSAAQKLDAGHSVDSVSQIVASVSGTVLDRKVTVGQMIQPSEQAFVVADLSTVWLVADIPEESAGDLRQGKVVSAEVLAFPNELIKGKLAFVSPIVNPATRAVRIRMNLPNPRLRYKPDMLANMSLSDVAKRELAVPTSAVVREDNKDYIFVQSGSNRFKLREVELGADLENRYEIASGLKPGEEVVTRGAFHLNNERKRIALTGAE